MNKRKKYIAGGRLEYKFPKNWAKNLKVSSSCGGSDPCSGCSTHPKIMNKRKKVNYVQVGRPKKLPKYVTTYASTKSESLLSETNKDKVKRIEKIDERELISILNKENPITGMIKFIDKIYQKQNEIIDYLQKAEENL